MMAIGNCQSGFVSINENVINSSGLKTDFIFIDERNFFIAQKKRIHIYPAKPERVSDQIDVKSSKNFFGISNNLIIKTYH
ncbi:MAG: hypothetical protein OEY59_10705, partial [Deltaproteobacteria bacterium]|nr:hypothetical protein [Deltaproteobacteria bacterium]